jgi:hypothetical protein
MVNLQIAKAKIIQKLQETDEAWIIRSIQKLLDIEEEDVAEEKDFWNSVALGSLENAYSVDEPDYDHYEVKEPNPAYKS